ncbi:MAG TPA: LCP family protein [Micromonosporaceae bacterium]
MGESAEPPARAGRRRWTIWAAAIAAVAVLTAVAVARDRRPTTETAEAPVPSHPVSPSPAPSPSPEPGADITGPLNILLVGVDTRISVPDWQPHADAVLIMHVPAGLDRAYLFSLPRDLVVDIPSFPKAGFAGQRTKLTHAMSYGSRVPGRNNDPDYAQGLELVAATVGDYTGIERFDAGAVITFQGFDALVDAVGGVELYIDQRVVSRHRQPDGKHRKPGPGVGGYVGPQMVYEVGSRHLNGWQALDYARQRYIPGGTYARERHQQQLIKAIVARIHSLDLARDPVRLGAMLNALDETLTFDGHGRSVIDFAFALSRIPTDAITLVSLPGHGVGSGSGYRGEALEAISREFLAELRAGRVEPFLAANPDLVVPDPPGHGTPSPTGNARRPPITP